MVLNDNRFMEKSRDYSLLKPWLNNGLLIRYFVFLLKLLNYFNIIKVIKLISGGSKWFHRRKLLTPSFHFDILKDFLSVMNEKTNLFIEKLKLESQNNKDILLQDYISQCALDILCGNKIVENLF